jgi:hypothetical protein
VDDCPAVVRLTGATVDIKPNFKSLAEYAPGKKSDHEAVVIRDARANYVIS